MGKFSEQNWGDSAERHQAERDASVAACEARAGAALRALTESDGLTLREAVEWCGGEEQLTVREATRLRRIKSALGSQHRTASEPEPESSSVTEIRDVREPADDEADVDRVATQ